MAEFEDAFLTAIEQPKTLQSYRWAQIFKPRGFSAALKAQLNGRAAISRASRTRYHS